MARSADLKGPQGGRKRPLPLARMHTTALAYLLALVNLLPTRLKCGSAGQKGPRVGEVGEKEEGGVHGPF